MNPVLTENMLNQTITGEKAAVLLGVSTATVRNWVKCGHLNQTDEKRLNFKLSEINSIKEQISNGELKKLDKRANKSRAEKTFIPEEYLNDELGYHLLQDIITFIQSQKIDIQTALLCLAINILIKEKILSSATSEQIKTPEALIFFNKQLANEIKDWVNSIPSIQSLDKADFLITCPLPKQQDLLGSVYQSLLLEGEKSKTGSYYTPRKIVDDIVDEYVRPDAKVLDPCCGTGQFLLSFAKKIKDPTKIYGLDIDPIAVRIARINILVKFKNNDFTPNIVCKNTLFDLDQNDLFGRSDKNIEDFDVIATNPPWGLHFSKSDIEKLKISYRDLSSLESFSYFLKKSLNLLNEGGALSFILPESILNVTVHQDIRQILANKSQIKKIWYLDRVFKNVFTPVIRLDLQKNDRCGTVKIIKGDDEYYVDQARWKNNEAYVFDIHMNDQDSQIINKLYETPHQTLRNQADWALGIVTGNNNEFLSTEPDLKREPIYKGKEINRFIFDKPKNYIEFVPQKFQQVAPAGKYRAPEKLVYRFISKNLIFAYDDQQRLTLNSANIIIPKIKNYPIKAICALFNSSLYQFLFQKKFSTIKILRSHLEQLPIPCWDETVLQEIADSVNKIMAGQSTVEDLDQHIMELFKLSKNEIEYINDFNK